MIMCVLLCYPVSIHMSQLLSTGHPISSCRLRSARDQMKNGHLLTLIIHGKEALLYLKKYIPLAISSCTGHIQHLVDSKLC